MAMAWARHCGWFENITASNTECLVGYNTSASGIALRGINTGGGWGFMFRPAMLLVMRPFPAPLPQFDDKLWWHL